MLPSSCSCSHSTAPSFLLQGRAAPLCGPHQNPHGSLCARHITFSSRPPRFMPQTSSFLCNIWQQWFLYSRSPVPLYLPSVWNEFACLCSTYRVLQKITQGLQFSALLLPEPLETFSMAVHCFLLRSLSSLGIWGPQIDFLFLWLSLLYFGWQSIFSKIVKFEILGSRTWLFVPR